MKIGFRIGVIMAALVMIGAFSGCKSVKLADGEAAYARGEYFEAQKIYKKVYNRLTKREDRPLRGEVAFKLGLCYDKLNQGARASAAFQNALRFEYPDSMAYFYLGKSLQSEGKYGQAIKAYEDFMTFVPDDHLALEGIRGCEMAIVAKEKPRTRYIVKNAKLFNSSRSDFSPMFLDQTAEQLYFTSNNEKVTGENKSAITGIKAGDIYFSRKNERGQWMRPEPVEGELNSDADEGVISFSPDGQTMYLTRAITSETSNATVEIYTSRRSDASWSAPEKFVIVRDSVTATGHPAVSANGKHLYFTSDMPGGYGGLDIWRIDIDDRVGTLQNMGPQINTPGDEMFPYSRTDSLFYFASNGHPGFGGLDLFRAKLNSTGDYWSVENMGLPMNSAGDDFGITFGEGESGFFSSNRGDARGYDHIFSFELPDLKITISGYVIDKDEEPVLGAVIRIVGDDGSNQREVARDDGSFRFNLGRGVKYVMKAGAPGYLNVKQEFESDIAEEDADYSIDFILAAINKPQVVENIFYDFDKATLRPESKEALDEIVAMLNENPHVSIEMGSHTDRKGSDEYNIALSERRAKSVIDYLIKAGINEDRLSPKGYGESVPKTVTKRINRDYPQFEEGTVLTEEFILTLSPEDQEAADQINRRTEFQVLSIEYDLF
ncbi:MAG: OmpA family protein [Muribaculaceae bacterium]|nr:OmpA family protein [Muribaculaceae bacterium]